MDSARARESVCVRTRSHGQPRRHAKKGPKAEQIRQHIDYLLKKQSGECALLS